MGLAGFRKDLPGFGQALVGLVGLPAETHKTYQEPTQNLLNP